MTIPTSSENESLHRDGGEIPGSGGQPAFSLTRRLPSPVPVLVSVPHAGRAYPHALLERMRHPVFASLKLEDRFVDRLAEAIAQATGAALLVAHAPRAMVDLNRAEDDVDWEMIGGGAPDDLGSYAPGHRARSGLGLIPRRLPGLGEVWKRRHERGELAARIADIHRPYHACLAQTLGELRDRWGAALLIDLHSMPPLASRGGQPTPHFVIGDRFGASCHGGLVATTFAQLAERGRLASHNRPYAGGYVLERHAAPHRGIHAMQIEIDRSCYLDSRLTIPGPGFARMVADLIDLVSRLAGEVASMGCPDTGRGDATESWPEAAE